MRPKLKEESQEIDKMSVAMLNYYQDAEAHIDELEWLLKHVMKTATFEFNGEDDFLDMGRIKQALNESKIK